MPRENPALWTEATGTVSRALRKTADLLDSAAVAKTTVDTLKGESLLVDGVDLSEVETTIREAVDEWNSNPILRGGPTLAFHICSSAQDYIKE